MMNRDMKEYESFHVNFINRLEELGQKYDLLDVENKDLVIWGMGNTDNLYSRAYIYDNTPIKYYVNNSEDTIDSYKGIPTVRPREILKLSNEIIILICAQNCKVVESIVKDIHILRNKRSVEYMLISEYFIAKYTDVIFRNIAALGIESRYVYEKVIINFIDNIQRTDEIFCNNHFFAIPEFYNHDKTEVYIDAGGYVGDTLEQFLFTKFGLFSKYYVFEPDKGNYNALLCRINRLNTEWNLELSRIIPVFAGVGSISKDISFLNTSSAQSTFTNETSGDIVKVFSIDDYFMEQAITTIKADIEGFEYDMLQGAIQVINRDKPKLAISIYHNAFDLIKIMDFLIHLNLDYKFEIRCHSYVMEDIVLYAY